MSSRRQRIPVGISACLVGQRVRYDGDHKKNTLDLALLETDFQWVPVCPEVEVGMGVPREPIELVEHDGDLRLLGVGSRTDHTAVMTAYARSRIRSLEQERIRGYLFKARSPSCGVTDTIIRQEGGLERRGSGIFAALLAGAMPLLPLEDEGGIADGARRERWMTRVKAYDSLESFFECGRWTVKQLVVFHEACGTRSRDLDRFLAGAAELPRTVLRAEYSRRSMRIVGGR